MKTNHGIVTFKTYNQARNNLLSEQGKALRCERVPEVETVSGQIKHNQRFRRLMLRGLLCFAHNIKKASGSLELNH